MTACFGLDSLFSKSPASPSDATPTYTGTWTSTSAGTPGAQTCTGMQWKVTSQTSTQITGEFSGSCAGGIQLAGNVVGTITDASSLPWAASGNATQDSTSCAFNLTGTGTLQGTTSIAVNYSGTVCGVPISGSETIKR